MHPANEIRTLTGVRAFAAFWVVLYHLRYFDPLESFGFLQSNAVIGRGYWAVDLFFVLSGFIIATVYHQRFVRQPDRRQFRDYILLRWARLYPIHFVMFLCYLALVAAASATGDPIHGEDSYTLQQAVAHLTLTQAWQWADGLSWNWPSWSISAEFFAYAFLFPAYFLLFRRLPMTAVIAVLALAWGAAYTYGLQSGHGFKTFHSGMLRITAEFLGGYVLYFAVQRWPLTSTQTTALFAVSALGLLALCYLPVGAEVLLLPLLMGVIASLALAGHHGQQHVLSRVFGAGVVVYLGHISYSLYMVHDFVNVIGGQVIGRAGIDMGASPLLQLGLTLVMLLASTAAAAAGFHLVENPARLWMKKRLRRTRDKPAEADTVAAAAASR